MTGSHVEAEEFGAGRSMDSSCLVIVGKTEYMGGNAGKWVDVMEE